MLNHDLYATLSLLADLGSCQTQSQWQWTVYISVLTQCFSSLRCPSARVTAHHTSPLYLLLIHSSATPSLPLHCALFRLRQGLPRECIIHSEMLSCLWSFLSSPSPSAFLSSPCFPCLRRGLQCESCRVMQTCFLHCPPQIVWSLLSFSLGK